MVERITQAEFARRIGKSPQYVSELVKSKKITLGKDKKIDYKKALHQLDKNSERITSLTNQSPASSSNDDEEDIDGIPTEELKDYKHWKTIEAEFKAKERELAYEEKKKNLIPIEKVCEDGYKAGNLLKEQFLSMPERLCNIFAAEQNAMVIREMWLKEIKRVLNEMADSLQEKN